MIVASPETTPGSSGLSLEKTFLSPAAVLILAGLIGPPAAVADLETSATADRLSLTAEVIVLAQPARWEAPDDETDLPLPTAFVVTEVLTDRLAGDGSGATAPAVGTVVWAPRLHRHSIDRKELNRDADGPPRRDPMQWGPALLFLDPRTAAEQTKDENEERWAAARRKNDPANAESGDASWGRARDEFDRAIAARPDAAAEVWSVDGAWFSAADGRAVTYVPDLEGWGYWESGEARDGFAAVVAAVRGRLTGPFVAELRAIRAAPTAEARAAAALAFLDTRLPSTPPSALRAERDAALRAEHAVTLWFRLDLARTGPPEIALDAVRMADRVWHYQGSGDPMRSLRDRPSRWAGPLVLTSFEQAAGAQGRTLWIDWQDRPPFWPLRPTFHPRIFGTTEGRTASVAALSEPDLDPPEIGLFMALLTAREHLWAGEARRGMPAPAEPLTAETLPEHRRLVDAVGAYLLHADPAVRTLAATALGRFLPRVRRGDRGDWGQWTDPIFKQILTLHDLLPPGATRNNLGIALARAAGLDYPHDEYPTRENPRGAAITGSAAPVFVYLPVSIEAPAGGAAAVPLGLLPSPLGFYARVRKPTGPAAVVTEATLVPVADDPSAASIEAPVAEVTLATKGTPGRAVAEVTLQGVPPGDYLLRLTGAFPPPPGDDENGSIRTWQSEPTRLTVLPQAEVGGD